MLLENFKYIIEEFLYEYVKSEYKEEYYKSIVEIIVDIGIVKEFIIVIFIVI